MADGNRTRAAAPVFLPMGWGFAPGSIVGEPTPDMLPALPLLSLLGPKKRNQAITAALRPLPYLDRIQSVHLRAAYDINLTAARRVLAAAKERA